MKKLSQVIKEKSYIEAIYRYNKVDKLIQRVQRGLAIGVADISKFNDKAQCTLYEEREKLLANQCSRKNIRGFKRHSVGLERSIGLSKDILSIEFFEAGLLAARSVGYISVNYGAMEGTGFLIGNGMLITNNHVLPNEMTAYTSSIEFDKEGNQYGAPKSAEQFSLDPDRFFLTDETLDYTIIAVSERSGSGKALSNFGYLPLIPRRGKIRIGDSVNIIQHPGGQEKAVVVHNSNLLHMENKTELEPFLWYSSDTEPGSSGSPVFNNRWEIIALHHRAVPNTDQTGKILSIKGKAISDDNVDKDHHQIRWLANEGIRASVIVEAVRKATFENEEMSILRDNLVKLWENTLFGLQDMESLRGNVGTKLPQPKSTFEKPLCKNEYLIKVILQAINDQQENNPN